MKITAMTLTITRQKQGEQVLSCEKSEEGRWEFSGEKATGCITLEKNGNVWAASLHLELGNEAFRENDNLACTWPVKIEMVVDQLPQRMTAMYLHRDWWTRPAFLTRPEEMPERTQFLAMETQTGAACLLPLAGKEAKTVLGPGREGVFTLRLSAYRGGYRKIEEPLFLLAEGENVYNCAHELFRSISEERHLPLRKGRRYPEMFEYLGWCSWDAFYTDISEEKVRAKAAELAEKQVPVRWFLMDDGWLSVHGQQLYDLMPEVKKFPNGFAPMIQDLRREDGIRWFGVWHALGSYWGGVEPGSKAALEEKDHLYKTASGKLLPYPCAEKGYGFFRDWYEQLRAQGIDFVKVDGQSAIKNYYENEFPVCEAARETHEALEGAAASYMDGRLINCMGMAMENILGRPASGMSRNSDDFVPDNPTGFAEHLLQNSYNALYHNEFYHCDWDMFWTAHPDAEKHGILRAVSGGPIYFSDRIGETAPDSVKPLVYGDGRILRLERAAMPAPDCLFADPLAGGLLKVTNLGACGDKKAGAVAVYNLCGKEAETTLSAKDIHDLPAGEYEIYDWKNRRTISEGERISLPADGCGLYLFLPVGKAVTPVGLVDKYSSFHALETVAETDHSLMAVLKDGGEFGFLGQKPARILVNGEDRTGELQEKNGLWTLQTHTTGKTVLLLEW